MVRKVVVSLAVAGSLTLGSAALSVPAVAAGKAPCTGAASMLARWQSEEGNVSARLAAAQSQLAQAKGTGARHRLQARIAELTKEQARLAAEVRSLLGRCPGAGTGSGGGTVIVA